MHLFATIAYNSRFSWRTFAGLLSTGLAYLLISLPAVAAQQIQANRICDQQDDSCLLRFLDRVTWGASAKDWKEIKAVGVDRYLSEQMSSQRGSKLPPEADAKAEALDLSGNEAIKAARAQNQEGKRISEIKDLDSRQSQSRANRKLADLATDTTTQYFIVRSIYSDQQVRERMTWFWANHFSVDAAKGNSGFMLPNYLAMIRSHALGNFRDLLRGVVKSPSMLVYLDNTRNRKGRINENLARELLELHTLGASGGYSQADVTSVAHVLTGLGVTYEETPRKLPSSLAPYYSQDGLFEFNPKFHDDTSVEVLGKRMGSKSAEAIDALVDQLAKHPSTAKFIAKKLLIYFVQDEPAQSDIDTIASAFKKTDGDIASTVSAVLHLPAFRKSLDVPRFKSPIAYVFSTVRRTDAHDGSVIDSAELSRHLAKLGSRLFRRVTPDGYPMQSERWTGSGQLLERINVARRIAYSKSMREQNAQHGDNPACLSKDAGFSEVVVKTLREETRKAVVNSPNRETCSFLLYSSPDFMMH